MPHQSSNGSDPAANRNGAAPEADDETGTTEFERFESLARKLVNTPKAEVDKARKKDQREPVAPRNR